MRFNSIATMKVLLLISITVAIVTGSGQYEGFKVYQLQPTNQQQQNLIAAFSSNEYFDFWSTSRAVGLPTTVMVHPIAEVSFLRTTNQANITSNLLIENVETLLKAERKRQRRTKRLKGGQINFTAYHRYSDIENYIRRLANDYPDIVTLEHFQTTHEERPIWLVKIGAQGTNKPVILIDGGIHAREWISPPVVLYVIHQLVEKIENRHLIEHVDWYIIPVLNPDGYEYSYTDDRLWRKNRASIVNSTYIGVDLNRNFDIDWGKVGVSHNPNTVLFPGRAPFDQLESRGLRDIVFEHKDRIKLYLTFHSAAELIVYPWGYTREIPSDAPTLRSLGEDVAAAIRKVEGTVYSVGTATNLMGPCSGASDDWVKAIGGVNLSYTIELPANKDGGSMFLLPPERILPVCRETFEGVKAFHRYIEAMCGYTY